MSFQEYSIQYTLRIAGCGASAMQSRVVAAQPFVSLGCYQKSAYYWLGTTSRRSEGAQVTSNDEEEKQILY